MSPKTLTIDPSELNKISEVIQYTASSELFPKAKAILGDESLIGVLNKNVNPIIANNQEKEKAQNKWSIYSENTRNMKFIKDAIDARHAFFKDTAQSLECGQNIDKVMTDFSAKEIDSFNQLQSIFNGLKESNNIALEYNNSIISFFD